MKDAEFELVLDRVMGAPREAVWRCWTDPHLLEQWFCPRPWHVTDAVLELRPGGQFSTVMHGPDGEEFPTMGVFLEVVEGRKLVSTDAFTPGWRPAGKPFMASEVVLDDDGRDVSPSVRLAMSGPGATIPSSEQPQPSQPSVAVGWALVEEGSSRFGIYASKECRSLGAYG